MQSEATQRPSNKSRIEQKFMKHAYNGKPECAHCRKQFSSWRVGRSRRKELLPRSPTLLLFSWLHRSQHHSLTGWTFRPQPGQDRKQTCQL